MLTKTLKLRASSSAFIKGRLVFSDWSTGCIRNLLFKSYGIVEPFKEETAIRGAENEVRFEKMLADAGIAASREVVSPCTSVSSTVAWGGRSDFVQPNHIYELKSSGSKNKLRDLKAGKYTTENLAQLVAYMLDFEIDTGSLIYTWYDGKTVKYEREFKVSLDDAGTILVDNRPTAFTIADQLEHRLQAAHALEHDIVWDRPYNWASQWGSPCSYCPFSSVCNAYDAGLIRDVEGLLTAANKLFPGVSNERSSVTEVLV